MPHQPVAPGSQKRTRKGPRPKHVPTRTCVACREQGAKRALTRIVRTPEGTVEIDPTGKRNGRGAYLCDRRNCWERATTTPVLSRALNIPLPPDAIATLNEFAAGLPVPEKPEKPETSNGPDAKTKETSV